MGAKGVRANAQCSGQLLERVVELDEESAGLLRTAGDQLGLSARGVHRTMRVARTLADLDGSNEVLKVHVAEALSYRGETLEQRKAA